MTATVRFHSGSLDGTSTTAPGEFALRFITPATFNGMRAVETYVRSEVRWEADWHNSDCEVHMVLESLQVTEVPV